MKTRFLGRTGMKVSELCLGTANFGAKGVYEASGRIEQKEADKIISTALDSGIIFFNTAERYSYGIAEEVFGRALGKRRHEAIIITKISPARYPGPNDGGLSRKHIIEGCEASLKRLGTDYIDIYQNHEYDPYTPLEVFLRAMDDLVRQGKVRYIGCSNFTGWQLMKSLSISDRNGWERFSTLEMRYSLCSRTIENEHVPICLDQGLALLPWSPLHGGYLTGKYKRELPMPEGARFSDFNDKFMEVVPEKLFKIIEKLDEIAGDNDRTVSQVALNYLIQKPAVTSLIIGVRNSDQLKENIKAVEWQMTQEEIEALDRVSQPQMEYPYFVFDPELDKYVRI
jgi:aryl-alcohol dehydrogenase-like predicted oxidoreductase